MDNLGDLIIDRQSINAGGFYDFDPLATSPIALQFQVDQQAKQDCCIDSDNCDVYHQVRQINNCSNYRPPRISTCSLFENWELF